MPTPRNRLLVMFSGIGMLITTFPISLAIGDDPVDQHPTRFIETRRQIDAADSPDASTWR